ncbi:hypothetical protein XPA_010094 [Xanthoria parietina]
MAEEAINTPDTVVGWRRVGPQRRKKARRMPTKNGCTSSGETQATAPCIQSSAFPVEWSIGIWLGKVVVGRCGNLADSEVASIRGSQHEKFYKYDHHPASGLATYLN